MSRYRDHSCWCLLGSRHLSIMIGLFALAWLILRTGRKPSRFLYPCQRAAASTSWLFLGVPLAGIVTSKRWPRPAIWGTCVAVALGVFVLLGVPSFRTIVRGVSASALSRQADRVPAWIGGTTDLTGRVVHVRDTTATYWDYATGWYGDYVDQDVVTIMITVGLLELTETHTLDDAWATLIPGFQEGEKLVIKVNFNNVSFEPPGNAIDAIIEPVNALLGGLIDYGFAASDISVYDVTFSSYHGGIVPQRFRDGCDYPGVNFVQYVDNPHPYSDTARVYFYPPTGPGIADRPLADVLVEADYLINMPILKAHDYAGMSLAFKNHLGSFRRCETLHGYLFMGQPDYSPDYSPIVDLYLNRHIGQKTVLTVCDGLYGNWEHLHTPPPPWPSFGNGAPNSILLATDPVAVDCVGADILAAEGNIPATADDYLVLASGAGLGVFERASSPGVYSIIDYRYTEGPFSGTGVHGETEGDDRRCVLSVTPNPSSGTAVIGLTLPRDGETLGTVRIYSAQGRLVATLMENESIRDGLELAWNGEDDEGNRVASGVYWCRLDYEGRIETTRIVLVR